MHQVYQLQQQIQRLQQEINSISQVCSQLQQSEQSNALQLQQMSQKEAIASQGLRRIQQAAGLLSQELNQISNITQQMASQVSPFQRNLQGTGAYTGFAGQTGTYFPQTLTSTFNQPATGILGGGQYGTFGQFGQNLSSLGTVPNYNVGTYTSQLQPFSQGYGAQALTGGQYGTSQAFSNIGASQFGTGQQQALTGQQGTASNLIGIMSPMMNNPSTLGLVAGQGQQGGGAFLGQSNFGQSNIGQSYFGQGNIGQSGMAQTAGLQSYSPYQANQFGFR